MNDSTARNRRAEWVVIAALTAAAAGLRFYKLGQWSISGDEYWTLRDSVNVSFAQIVHNTRPLLYLVNHYLILPFGPLHEFQLRLVPALAGIVTVPIVYVLMRRLTGSAAAFATAALITFGTWPLYWSQFARYYTLVFLFTAIFLLALLLWRQERSRGWGIVAAVAAILALLSHPSAAPVIATGAGAAGLLEWRERGRKLTRWQWGAIVVVAAGAALVAWRLADILAMWWNMDQECCHNGVGLVLSMTNWLTAPLVVWAAVGFGWWWWDNGRGAGPVVAVSAIVPIAVFAVLAQGTSVSVSYLFATAPLFFMSAGWLAGHVADGCSTRSAAVATLVAITAALAAANVVGVASQYRDGDRLPYHRAADILGKRMQEGEGVVAFGHLHLQFYAPGLDVEELPEDSSSMARLAGEHKGTWVLIPVMERGGFGIYESAFSGAGAWVHRHCDLMGEIGTPRLDFRRNGFSVAWCPPGDSASSVPVPAPLLR